MTYFRVIAALGLILLACGEDEDPKHGNGVNDVRLACEIRTKWVREGNDCSVCEAGAITARCDCSSLQEFSSVCSEQEDARKASCSETITNCVFACNRDDCNCLDNCYAADARCKSASAARDGCVADTCASHCK
jgi:hypothetical protein